MDQTSIARLGLSTILVPITNNKQHYTFTHVDIERVIEIKLLIIPCIYEYQKGLCTAPQIYTI